MRQPDLVAALVAATLAVVLGLLVVNAVRGETERATTGAAIVLVLSLALAALRTRRDG